MFDNLKTTKHRKYIGNRCKKVQKGIKSIFNYSLNMIH